MNKLQLYITKSFDGYKVLFNINPSEEITRHIREIRDIVNKVKYDPTEKNIFYFVTTVGTGTFVTIIRTIPTAPVDHLAAWIYIPNELVIDGETLERVVNTTTRKVSGDRVTTDDVAILRELFSTEYMTDAGAPAMTASKNGNELAWRKYNGDTGMKLKDLFGAGLFQLSYLDYAGVVFVDGDLGLEVEGADLTGLPIAGPAVILPPKRTPENFVAHVFGRALECPVRGSLGANIAVVWKHPGFEEVVKQEVINEGEFLPTMPDTSESRKAVTTASFQIMAQSGHVILEDCSITVNGDEITSNPRLYTTAQLSGATVVINCEGYAPYSAKMDLASSTRALIRLQERTKVYCFEMPVKSASLGAPVRFKLYTKKVVKSSPLEGYSAHDEIQEGETRTNHLTYTGGSVSTVNKVIYIVIGLVVGLLIGWISSCGGGKTAPTRVDSLATEQEAAEVTVTETTTPAATPAQAAAQNQADNKPTQSAQAASNKIKSAKEAIAYLDNNATWTKEELERYETLEGLFDDMNNFRLDKLSGTWSSKLKDSKNFQKVATAARNGNTPKKKQKSKIDGGKYLSDNQSKITVVTYTYRIDP